MEVSIQKESVIVNFAIQSKNVKPLLVSLAIGVLIFALISE